MKSNYLNIEREFKMTLETYPYQFDLVSEESKFLFKIALVLLVLLLILGFTTQTMAVPLVLSVLPLVLSFPVFKEIISFSKGLRKNKKNLIEPIKARIKEETGVELSDKTIARMWNYEGCKYQGKEYLVGGRQANTFSIMIGKA